MTGVQTCALPIFSGRLDNNLTVEFKADPALMGSYAMVRLTGARATVLLGELSE